jgi:hypothetical protein
MIVLKRNWINFCRLEEIIKDLVCKVLKIRVFNR